MEIGRRRPPSGTVAFLCLLCFSAIPAESVAQIAQWTVDGTPEVVIGELDGPDEYILTNPVDGLVLTDGTIVIRNSIRNLFELRYYAPDGEHIRTASRWGQGPFEFQFPTGVHRLTGDSVLVVARDGRYSVFGSRGEELDEGRLDLAGVGLVVLSGLLDDRTLLFDKVVGPPMPSPGVQRDERRLVRFDRETGESEEIAVYFDQPTFVESIERGVKIYPEPLSAPGYAAAGFGQLWIGDPVVDSIRRVWPAGDEMGLDHGLSSAPVARADERMIRELYARVFGENTDASWKRRASQMDVPDHMPAFGGLLVDRAGDVWVMAYEPPWAEGPQRWRVFSPEGHPKAEVSVPEAALPICARRTTGPCHGFSGFLDVGSDYLLVSHRDGFGVPSVRLFRIRKGS